ncbi:helix-turn-helix transcriptional regulator [Mobilicoccus pelagius]|uniref:HTH cro/C1-type domain-containing protein n=1 Tax=Mobilicoccus pelagius NBRC 104925 TaxID=1089455 RepID=H5UQ42_9MICO|nr:helix-turn-helix transcriptional regulator [Mobilicoccus pelagius]GAB47847.1 hypothetical protein MOPEL_029_01290 [Mobilicoccus pelagius NBRC 104925]
MTATTDARIGSTVQELRERRGLTQVRLAEAMSARGHAWHQQTVVKTEKGLRPLRLTEACDLASVLHVELPVLAGLEDTRTAHLEMRGHLDRAEEAERALAAAEAAAEAARASLRIAARGVDDLPADLSARVEALLPEARTRTAREVPADFSHRPFPAAEDRSPAGSAETSTE